MFNSIAIVTDVSQVRYYCWHNKIVQLSLRAGCGGVFGLVLEHIELWRRRTVIKSFWLVSMITEKACGTDIALEYNRYAGLKLSSTLIVFFQQCWRYQILCQKKPAGFLGFLLLLFLKKQYFPKAVNTKYTANNNFKLLLSAYSVFVYFGFKCSCCVVNTVLHQLVSVSYTHLTLPTKLIV